MRPTHMNSDPLIIFQQPTGLPHSFPAGARSLVGFSGNENPGNTCSFATAELERGWGGVLCEFVLVCERGGGIQNDGSGS